LEVCMKVHQLEEIGFSADRLERINFKMQQYIDTGKIAGIVTLVARRGHIAHFEKFGFQDLKTKKSMALDTIFRIYSMTKPITNVAIMMLYEQGLFHMNDPISKFISDFKDVKVLGKDGKPEDPEREITIHDLLTHTAGLSYAVEVDSPVDKAYLEAEIWDPAIDNREFVRRIATLPLRFHPGQNWYYSVATDVIGHLVEILSESSLPHFFEEHIFHPLGMKDTSFSVPPDKVDRFATLYGLTDAGPLELIEKAIGGEYFNVKVFYGGSGLVSTAQDYLRFAQLILNKGELDGVRLLGRKTLEWMTINHLPQDLLKIIPAQDLMPGFGFGIGFSIVMDLPQSAMLGSLGSHGWGGWASTHFWIDPTEEVIGILMLQYIPSGTYPIHMDIRNLTYQALID
jgi:CubicO group peptidase (beta-lactamase class C family)